MTGTPSIFGPQQFPDYLGLHRWQFDRAVQAGVIPPPDRARGRWSRAAVDAVRARLEDVRAAVGEVPDVGAERAAAYLAERLRVAVSPDAVAELARQGRVRTVDTYRGHPVYDGRDLERIEDLAVVVEAGRVGQQLARGEVAERLGVREVDVRHLERAGYLVPVRYVLSRWQRRREAPSVPLYRLGDVLALQERDDIGWEAVRAAVAPGARSPFAALPDGPTPA
ncbi:hypothetical protein [Streptomyces sp. NPDC007063]|uniref:hypothetical protein n=1 Tax=Streptomyces sp. NPDC007063 TaxID=3364772 RepID=UPI003697DD7D